MSAKVDPEPRDYHLHLMVERMQRDGRSEAAIEKTIRIASGNATGQDGRSTRQPQTTATRGKPLTDNGELPPMMRSMHTVWQEVTATLRPRPDSPDGPLPPLLLTLTVVTGLVDATSFLKLGHVFVANMTGNVVFLGFAIAGAAGISIFASLTAIGAFLVGGLAGGRMCTRWPTDRTRQLTAATSAELALVTGSFVVAAVTGHQIGTASHYAVIALLAVAMGIQNATARKLAVADLTTTVLTMTLTGIAADATLAGGQGSKLGRRLLSVTAMLLGALIGGLLVLKVDISAPLAVSAGLLATVSFFAYRASRASQE